MVHLGSKNVTLNVGSDAAPIDDIKLESVGLTAHPVLVGVNWSSGSTINFVAKNFELKSVDYDMKTVDLMKHHDVLSFAAPQSDPSENNTISIEASDKIAITGDIGSGYNQNGTTGTIFYGNNNTININQNAANNPVVQITGTVNTANHTVSLR